MIALFVATAISTAAVPDVTEKQFCIDKRRVDGGEPYTECTIDPPDWSPEPTFPSAVQEGKGDMEKGPQP